MKPKRTATMEYLSKDETIKLLGNSMISVQLANQNSSENLEDYLIKIWKALVKQSKEEEKERKLAEQEAEEIWRKNVSRRRRARTRRTGRNFEQSQSNSRASRTSEKSVRSSG